MFNVAAYDVKHGENEKEEEEEMVEMMVFVIERRNNVYIHHVKRCSHVESVEMVESSSSEEADQ